MLEQIIPFRYLTPTQRQALLADATEEVHGPGTVLIEQGDRKDSRVFLLLEGSVRVRDPNEAEPGHTKVITAGHYIGERAALFDEPRSLEARAIGRTRILCIPGERFLRLVHESTGFAQALGGILRSKQAIFQSFTRFRVALLQQIAEGAVDLERLLPLYEAFQPALHPRVSTPDALDVTALAYAVRRLPDNVTRTLAFFLTDKLPDLYADAAERFTEVPTAARRRTVFEMFPGKSMVLIRDGRTDVLDFVCCLCLYSIEARKLRRRVRGAGGLDSIAKGDIEALEMVWPENTEARIREVALHHEDFRIEVYREANDYNSAHAETWCKQVAEATRRLVGYDPADLPADFAVHVVSSNTHSVPNCLSPWIGREAERIVEWARATGHDLADDGWHHPHDLAYAVAPDFMEAFPEQAQIRAEAEEAAGIVELDWTAFTGIAVRLIDTTRVAWEDTDPGIPSAGPSGPSLIVNIDYAFGQQAQNIIANLASLFGHHLRSVNVLGKAGGLVGERGHVAVATGFVDVREDQFLPVPGGNAVDVERLRAALPGREVHVGNMLTVMGTLLQNRTMLHFNRHIWRCVGLEMEGAWYLRHIEQSMSRGSVPDDVKLRFLYYTSDLPLRHDANLSARLRAVEGVPPLYATTREILRGVLES
jgi:CRP-like cAMP-binding protein